jgi:hypothetical protein
MAKVRVPIGPPPIEERVIQCNPPISCVGCGTESGLETYDSWVRKRKRPIGSALRIMETRADWKLCASCKERTVDHYTNALAKRRTLRIIMILVGVLLLVLTIVGHMLLFPNFPFTGMVDSAIAMLYWGVMLAGVIFVFGFSDAIKSSRQEMKNRIEWSPFKAFMDLTINGEFIFSDETYAKQFQESNQDRKVQVKPGLKSPGAMPSIEIYFMMVAIFAICVLMAAILMIG